MKMGRSDSASGVVFPLDMAIEIGAIEIDLTQIAGAVAFCLIVKVWRSGVAALATGSDGLCMDLVAELDYGDEAVAAGAVPLLCSWIGARAERGKGAPEGGSKAYRNAWCGVVEGLNDVAG